MVLSYAKIQLKKLKQSNYVWFGNTSYSANNLERPFLLAFISISSQIDLLFLKTRYTKSKSQRTAIKQNEAKRIKNWNITGFLDLRNDPQRFQY